MGVQWHPLLYLLPLLLQAEDTAIINGDRAPVLVHSRHSLDVDKELLLNDDVAMGLVASTCWMWTRPSPPSDAAFTAVSVGRPHEHAGGAADGGAADGAADGARGRSSGRSSHASTTSKADVDRGWRALDVLDVPPPVTDGKAGPEASITARAQAPSSSTPAGRLPKSAIGGAWMRCRLGIRPRG